MHTPDPFIPLGDILAQVDTPWLLENTQRLWNVERGATFRHWHQAAELAERTLVEIGMERVERIAHPADGKTVYLDRRMPLAWDVTHATLTVTQPAGAWADPVIASYQRHPFHVVKGSSGTPAAGVLARVISEQQAYGGVDARGAMVVLEAESNPRANVISPLLDFGAIGFIDSHLTGQYDTPDALSWPNAATEGPNWHVQADDRDFLGFVVSPREGDRLRAAVRNGAVQVRIFSDARRYEGQWHTVTGVLPGEDPREVWLLAHLYEPMPDDNSSGVVGMMEVVRLLGRLIAAGRLPAPRFTVRVVFTAEMYGFAAYAALRGVPLRDRVIGAVNFDGMLNRLPGRLFLAPPGSPFCGDYLLERVLDEYTSLNLQPTISLKEAGMYGDDQFLNDPTTGLATAWLIGGWAWWHNSAQSMETINPASFAQNVALYVAWLARLLNLRDPQRGTALAQATEVAQRHIHQEAARILEKAAAADAEARRHLGERAPVWMGWRLERELGRLHDFERIWTGSAELPAAIEQIQRGAAEESTSLTRKLADLPPAPTKATSGAPGVPGTGPVPGAGDPVRDVLAAGIVLRRVAAGQPYDQATTPKEERTTLPGNVIYGQFADVLARADGRRHLKELVEYAEWVGDRTLSPRDIRSYISALELLARSGQVALSRPPGLTRAQVAAALRAVGVREGQLVFVHSKMSAFGHIEGGADTVIDAFLEVLGPRGTLLMPTFTQSAFYVNGDWLISRRVRPFNHAKAQVWVGQVPAAFLRRGAAGGVSRSVHPTHSVAGCGPLAQACLAPHRESDSPTGSTSPFARLVEHAGLMVWFGADLGCATFLHYLEDVLDLPYLQPAVARVQRADGRIDSVFMPRYLPGCRDFYRAPGETTKVYQCMIAQGLDIRETTLGLGKVRAIDAVAMNQVGRATIKADSWVLLCDRPDCLFCRTYNPPS